jgi:hypothetical protein
VVVLDDEIGSAFMIDELSLKRHDSGGDGGSRLYDFEIRMGLCASDVLGPDFADNYIPGTETTVMYCDSIEFTPEPDELIPIALDTPYWFNGQENLIIEILWSDGESLGDCVYSWQWNSGTLRCTKAGYESSTGSQTSLLPYLLLTGEIGLEPNTFCWVKSVLAE